MGLSVWQIKRQLAYLAASAAWADTPQGLVYTGGAFVSEDLEGNFRLGSFLVDGPLAKGGTDNAAGLAPFCRVRHLRSEWDKNSNGSRIERSIFQAWSTAGGGAVPGTPSQAGFDSHGINQVLGINRDPTTPTGLSQGRDIDELLARFCDYHGGHFVDATHGFQGRFSITAPMLKVNGSSVLKRAVEFEVFNTLQANYYHPARLLSAAAGGGGTVVLSSWSSPPARFDAFRYMVRKDPNFAVTSGPTFGTLVGYYPISVSRPLNITSQTPGTTTYALFVCYNETETVPWVSGAATDQFFSSPAIKQVVVV